MSKKNILFFGIVLILLSLTGCGNNSKDIKELDDYTSNYIENNDNNINDNSKYQTKSSSSTVSIDLQPTKIESKKLYVDVSINTHSVELSQFDLNKLSTLAYGEKSINPVSAPSLSGHHSSGVIIFEIEEDTLESFKIIINDFPDIKERTFEWP